MITTKSFLDILEVCCFYQDKTTGGSVALIFQVVLVGLERICPRIVAGIFPIISSFESLQLVQLQYLFWNERVVSHLKTKQINIQKTKGYLEIRFVW